MNGAYWTTNCSQTPYTIYLGDQKPINLVVAYNAAQPFDLTNCTQIIMSLPNADGTFSTLTLQNSQIAIASPPQLGAYGGTITTAISELLQVGNGQTIDVQFTISGSPTTVFTVGYEGLLNVLEPQPFI